MDLNFFNSSFGSVDSGIGFQQAIIQFLTPGFVWAYFAVIVGLVGVVSMIIVWHWTKYGKGIVRKVGTEIIYLVITAVLMIALFSAVASLASNL